MRNFASQVRVRGMKRGIWLILALFFLQGISFAQVKNEKELKKIAGQHFDEQRYRDALEMYSSLVANYPKDANYNYRYGACLIYADEDKSKGMSYLKYASTRPDVEPEAFYFLGKGHHLNYNFKLAIKFYERYKSTVKGKPNPAFDVDGHIQQAKNGQTLLKKITDIIVLEKKKLNEADYFKVYDLSDFGGKILLKPDEFKSGYEKKNNIESVVYLPENVSRLFFSRVDGEEGTGRDLYYADKTDKGWSSPKSLGKTVNTDLDEDYPFMHPDGQTLFFSSKGHNSLGGFDVFKTIYDSVNGTWSKPTNMDFAINTPDDDFLFITDGAKETAFFSSKRSSKQGEVHVYRINMQRVPLDVAVITGIFESNSTKSAEIEVVDVDRKISIGTFSTESSTGKYLIELPQTGKFQFLVDYKGSQVTHSGIVELKNQDPFKPLFQEMKIEKQGTVDEKLIIKNLLDVQISDDDPVIAEIFKQRAQLEVTSADRLMRLQNIETKELEFEEEEGPKVEFDKSQEEAQSGVDSAAWRDKTSLADVDKLVAKDKLEFELTGDDVSKEDIIKVSHNNAKSLEKDAKILELESEVAKNIAKEKRKKSRERAQRARDIMSKIDTTVMTSTNQRELQKVKYLERQAALLEEEAKAAELLASKLDDRAYQKKSGIAIASSYATQIENSIDENNTQSSLDKLKQLQEYVEEQKQEKSSINYSVEEVETKLRDKQTKLNAQQQYASNLEEELFTKEKTLLANNPDVSDPEEQAELIAKELKEDRLRASKARERADRTQQEVDVLKSDLKVMQQIIQQVSESPEIAQLAAETPDENVVPQQVDLSEFTLEIDDGDEPLAVAGTESTDVQPSNESASSVGDTQTAASVPQTPSTPSSAANPYAGRESSHGMDHTHTDYSSASGERFDPTTVEAQLEHHEDQSLMTVMRSGYNNAYQNDFMTVAEEPDELVRAVKTKVLNEDWLGDLTNEMNYLQELSANNTNPDIQPDIDQRLASVSKFRGIKRTEFQRNQGLVERLATERGEDPAVIEENVRAGNLAAIAQAAPQPTTVSTPESTPATSTDDGTEPAETTETTQPEVDEGSEEEFTEEEGTEPATLDEQSISEESSTSDEESTPERPGGEVGTDETEPATPTTADEAEVPETTVQPESTSTDQIAEPGQEEAIEPPSIEEPILPPSRQLDPNATGIPNNPDPESPSGQLVTIEESAQQISEVSAPARENVSIQMGELQEVLDVKEEELGALNTELNDIKPRKKKKRAVVEDKIMRKEAEIQNIQSQKDELRAQNEAIERLGSLDPLSFLTPVNELTVSEQASMKAQELHKASQDSLDMAADLLQTADNTKKKKVKKRLIKQAEMYTEVGNRLEHQAEEQEALSEELAAMEDEVRQVREKIKLDLPEVEAELTPAQADSVSKSPEFIKFKTQVAEGERKIRKADVLYEEVKVLEAQAELQEAEASELEEQAKSIEDQAQKEQMLARATQLKNQALESKRTAGKKRAEAIHLAQEGTSQRNIAIAEVINLGGQQSTPLIAMYQGSAKVEGGIGPAGFTPDQFSRIVQGVDPIPSILTSAIYKKIDFNESLYSTDNPIPINQQIPQGLVYSVQVGAFRLPISQDVFRGFAPVRGEDGPNGLTRYTAGFFQRINNANLARNEIRAIGYSDAFVVAYMNGQRISLASARAQEGSQPDIGTDLASTGVPGTGTSDAGSTTSTPSGDARVYEAEDVQGLYYTVQVGAYSREVSASAMYNLSPLVSHKVDNLVKYTSGIFNNPQDARVARDRIRNLGISDAFVTIYYQGERVSSARAQELVNQQGTSVFASESNLQSATPAQSTPRVQPSTPSTSAPATTSAGGSVEYRVQVGAYASEVPVEDAQIILSLSNLDIEVDDGGNLTKYVVGGYSSYQEATTFKDRIIGQGLNGAFVVAYQNGQKISVDEARRISGE